MTRALLVALLVSCGPGSVQVTSPSPQHEFSFCEFTVEGACVILYSPNMKVDPVILSMYLSYLEYEFNYFFPGLDLSDLAEQEQLDIVYKWANWSTNHQGEYADYETTAYIYLRRGEAIVPRIECNDRYFIVLHEVLHFLAERYLFYAYVDGDVHNVPNLFRRWALLNDQSLDLTVEGRLSTMVSRYCQTL
jgi:hypothetical protein